MAGGELTRQLVWRTTYDGQRVHALLADADSDRDSRALCGRPLSRPLYRREGVLCERCVQRSPDHVVAWSQRCVRDLRIVTTWAPRFPAAQLVTETPPGRYGWRAQLSGPLQGGIAVELGWHPSVGYLNVPRRSGLRAQAQTIEEEIAAAERAIRRYAQHALAIFHTWAGPDFDQMLADAHES